MSTAVEKSPTRLRDQRSGLSPAGRLGRLERLGRLGRLGRLEVHTSG